MTPPCGEPSVVGNSRPFSIYPHFINSFSMRLSAGIFSSIHWWLILSKQLFMSPSNIHCGESFLLSTLNAYSLASSGLLYLRNPNDILSAVVSATGSNARSCSACIALSNIVGIPNGLFSFFPYFSMYIRLNGLAWYVLQSSLLTASILALSVSHNSPSIPGVFFPLLLTTLFTANAFA